MVLPLDSWETDAQNITTLPLVSHFNFVLFTLISRLLPELLACYQESEHTGTDGRTI